MDSLDCRPIYSACIIFFFVNWFHRVVFLYSYLFFAIHPVCSTCWPCANVRTSIPEIQILGSALDRNLFVYSSPMVAIFFFRTFHSDGIIQFNLGISSFVEPNWKPSIFRWLIEPESPGSISNNLFVRLSSSSHVRIERKLTEKFSETLVPLLKLTFTGLVR